MQQVGGPSVPLEPVHTGGAYRWLVLLMTTLSQTGIAFISQGIGAIIPFLAAALSMNNAQIGLAVSAPSIGMALTAILFGRMVDHFGEKKVLVLGGLMVGISVAVVSQASVYWVLLMLLFETGLWCGSATPAGSKAIMTWFPYSMRAFAMSIRQTGVAGGGFLAALILPVLAIHLSWRSALLTAGACCILISLICAVAYREDKDMQRPAGARHDLADLLRMRALWFAGLGGTAYLGAQFIVMGYTQVFLKDTAHMPVQTTAMVLALAQLAGVIGRVVWGGMSDRWFRGRRKPVMLLIGVLIIMMSLTMLTISVHTPFWLASLMFFVLGFTAIGWNGVWVTLVSELSGPDRAATAVGMAMTLLQLGALVFPFLFGWLVDRVGTFSVSWLTLCVIVACGMVLLGRLPDRPATSQTHSLRT
ncbi:MAG: MFS transporter [Alicyclobacillus sp.]|nr:MFS transporter [Alicyclobacillus sp.]